MEEYIEEIKGIIANLKRERKTFYLVSFLQISLCIELIICVAMMSSLAVLWVIMFAINIYVILKVLSKITRLNERISRYERILENQINHR